MIISWMFFNTWNFLFELIPLQPFKSDKKSKIFGTNDVLEIDAENMEAKLTEILVQK